MSDAIKIAVKTALIAGVMLSAIAIINAITLPAIDFTIFRTAIGHGKAIVNYYGGTTLNVLFTIGLSLLTLKYVVGPMLAISSIAIRWIFKVNE